MVQNLEMVSLFFRVKLGFATELSCLFKLGFRVKHLPLLIGKRLGWIGERKGEV